MSLLKYLPIEFREKYELWFSSQNLNEKRNGLKGSKWRHGRCWLHALGNCIGLEWAFFWNSSTAIGITVGGEEELQLHIAIWRLFSLHFSVAQILSRRLTRQWKWWDRSWGRTTDIRIFDGSIWFNIFNDTTGWSRDQKPWQEFNFSFEDFFLGKTKHSKKVMDTGVAKLAFLEGSYSIKWTKTAHEWRRPRWFTQRIVRYNLEMDDNPIPVPGKGENSYDCEDDAIHSTSVVANNLSEALAKLTESVLRTRERYGWADPANSRNANSSR